MFSKKLRAKNFDHSIPFAREQFAYSNSFNGPKFVQPMSVGKTFIFKKRITTFNLERIFMQNINENYGWFRCFVTHDRKPISSGNHVRSDVCHCCRSSLWNDDTTPRRTSSLMCEFCNPWQRGRSSSKQPFARVSRAHSRKINLIRKRSG